MEMIEKIFLSVLDRGVEISCVILVVLAARLLLQRLPKSYSYFLWILVALRVIVPVETVSLFSPFSIFNLPVVEMAQDKIRELDNPARMPENDIIVPVTPMENTIHNELPAAVLNNDRVDSPYEKNEKREKTDMTITQILGILWLAGMAGLCVCSVFSYVRLRKKVSAAVRLRENIYECDNIAAPFVLGIIRPVIYIPFRLGAREQEYILLHEQYHIRRKDYLVKLSAFCITVVYWFNPLVWIAFFLMTRDMEMSCDEKVIIKLEPDARLNYGSLLLAFATNHRGSLANPLFFGEGDTKERIKNVLNIRKPKFWAGAAALVVFLTVGVLCLTGKTSPKDVSGIDDITYVTDETREFVRVWAENFCTRNGDGLLEVSEEGVFENNPFMEEGEDHASFGTSSPWPWIQEENAYQIREISSEEADIFYYARTSAPYVYTWHEHIRFHTADGKLMVYEEKLTGVDSIETVSQMKELYPEGKIEGTMMDYRTNGLGIYLQQNYLLGRLEKTSLRDAEWSACYLLNISAKDTIYTGIYDLQNEKKAEIIIYFAVENEVVLVTMERFNEMKNDGYGIWVPVHIDFVSQDKASLIETVLLQKQEHSLIAHGAVEYREIDLALDSSMPPYNIFEEGFIMDADYQYDFYYPYTRKMYTLPGSLLERCNQEEISQWHERYSNHIPASELGKSGNMYAFISDFAFSFEEIRKEFEIERELLGEQNVVFAFTDEEAKILFSGDEVAVTNKFVSEYAIAVGRYAYSPLWLYTHTAKDYETVGITREAVREKVAFYERLLLPFEAKVAFAAKINDFLGEELWQVKE